MRGKKAKALRIRARMLWNTDIEQLSERFITFKRFYKLSKNMWKKHGLVISRIGEKDGKKLYLFHR